jgi:hypothetical protein
MGRLFVLNTSYLEAASVPISGYPFTMACWANVASLTAQHRLLTMRNTASTDNHGLRARGDVAQDPLEAISFDFGVNNASARVNNYPLNTWFHACGKWTNAASRAIHLNGGTPGTNTTNVAADVPNIIRIGDTSNSANEIVCEAGIWNVILSTAEALALAKGIHPTRIRRANLVFYAPVWGTSDPERDYTEGQRHLTLIGSPVVDQHARVAPMFASFEPQSGL